MNILETLEWNKIIENLSKFASSKLSREKIADIKPMKALDDIEEAGNYIDAAIEMILKIDDPPLYGIKDHKPSLHRASIGGALSPGQLLDIGDTLRVCKALKDYAKEVDQNLIKEKILLLYTNPAIEKEISKSIISEDEISDNASRKLFTIRSSMRQKQESIRSRLENIVKNNDSNILQEQIVTMRDGRYVIPIKAEKKRSIEGIIHDQSATGQTVYIEPKFVVELNNEIRQLELDERDEIQRILKNLTELIVDCSEELLINQDILVDIDFNFAKAKYALKIGATKPLVNDDHVIDLKSARHPLLKGKVVPIDFKIGETYSTLVITGPNTGGKTVTLKTVGLISLMAMSGLFIPAKENSKTSIFDNIYADIGDKQSIEMSLSTFSASMKNIVEISNCASSNSLVLFDELGAGTDPTEGAALAMSILDDFTRRRITTVTTTHYSELKLYAISTEFVQNASVEFDVKTLSPTYKLIIGMPGKSNAFEISKRLGLKRQIIENATNYVSSDALKFEDMLRELDENRREAEERLKFAKKLQIDNEELKERLKKDQAKADKSIDKILEDARIEAQMIIEEAKKSSSNMLKVAKRSVGENTKNIDRAMNEINLDYQEISSRYKKKPGKVNKKTHEEFKIGDRVHIQSLNQDAEVVTAVDKNGDLQVQAGILKFNVNKNDLVKLEKQKEKQVSSSIKKILRSKSMQAKTKIDLRGENLDDALYKLEKFIDDGLLSNAGSLEIIHGKGTGVLRDGINKFLKKHKSVSEYRYGKFDEGGDGVTIVKLK